MIIGAQDVPRILFSTSHSAHGVGICLTKANQTVQPFITVLIELSTSRTQRAKFGYIPLAQASGGCAG